MISRRRTLPAIIEEETFYPIFTESPDTILAKQESLAYLETLKEKIKYDHQENVAKIKNNHEQVLKGMQYQAANNYISGLSSSDRLEIESVETLPYVWEDTIFRFKTKSEGITLRVSLR